MHDHRKTEDKEKFLLQLYEMTTLCRTKKKNWKEAMKTILPWFCLWYQKNNFEMRRKGGHGRNEKQYRAASSAKFVTKHQYGAKMSVENMQLLNGKSVEDCVTPGLEAFLYLIIRNTIKATKVKGSDDCKDPVLIEAKDRPFTQNVKKENSYDGGWSEEAVKKYFLLLSRVEKDRKDEAKKDRDERVDIFCYDEEIKEAQAKQKNRPKRKIHEVNGDENYEYEKSTFKDNVYDSDDD